MKSTFGFRIAFQLFREKMTAVSKEEREEE